jgi:uncharacterized damage-inducible protein DinB
MDESERITVQMRQAFEGGAWHGPSLLEILDDVSSDEAAARPIHGAHSIWEIVLHLTGTQKLMMRRIAGDETATELPPEEDWPAVERQSREAWQEAMDVLRDGDQCLREAVRSFPDDCLDQPFIPGGSSAYNNFHGTVQHSLFHAAQIGMLKKAARR